MSRVEIKPEKERINVVAMIRRFNENREEGSEKMTIVRLGKIVFPEYAEPQQKFRLSRMNNGFVDFGRVLPSHYRKICEVLNCTMSELFDLTIETQEE